jgi:ABC-type sugar transport system ATPase subunit
MGVENLLLEMSGIEKSFPGVHALKNAGIELRYGEVLALIGENGAGKSTLMKVLGGAYLPDAGRIMIEGRELSIRSPSDSRDAGVAIIYQEFNLIPCLNSYENIFLGREKAFCGMLDMKKEISETLELFEKVGVRIDPELPCRNLSVAQQQCVEIAKALSGAAKIIVMDEPSAALTTNEVEKLFQIIRGLKTKGIGVIYISHRLDEIFEIADRITVMRDAECVGTRGIAEIKRGTMIEMMVGRTLDREFPARNLRIGKERFRVEHLSRKGAVNDVSFSACAGEIVALTGLVGSGRSETVRLIFGADRADSGEIFLDGRKIRICSPRHAIRNRIGLLTEDRKSQGLVLGQSVLENFALPNLDRFSNFAFVNSSKEEGAFSKYVEAMRIKIPFHEELAKNLSGGNQQKVVLAKWLERNCDVLIFDEPTRGIDVGAKYEIYLLMNELVAAGKTIIMISSEMPEVLGMADRILVMHDGRITGEIRDVAAATQEQLMALAVA